MTCRWCLRRIAEPAALFFNDMANKNPKQSKQFRDNMGRFARNTTETQREIARKGAEASNQVQAENKTLIGTIAQVIDVELNPDKVKQRVINLGYPPEMAEKVTPRLMIAIGFLNRCIGKADPNSIKLLAEFLGEYVETIRHELPQDEEDTVYRRKKDEVG